MVVAPMYRTMNDFLPVAKEMAVGSFASNYPHPFLLGREVLEDEFRFRTLITEASREMTTEGYLEIRHWVIPVKKPEGAPAKERVFIGRAESNDICVPHITVSKLHGYFVNDTEESRWSVVDTGSANGIKNNGVKVLAREKVPLNDGDVLMIGRCVFLWLSAKSLHERVLSERRY